MRKILLLITISLLILGCGKEVEVKATVLDHAITANKYGDRTYSTVIQTDDGYIQELTSLRYYSIPKGETFYIKVWRRSKI